MGVYYISGIPFGDELYHHGIKGQKWGIRRSREELGYDTNGRLNAVQRRIAKLYSKNMSKHGRLMVKANARKKAGKNASKLFDKAKRFMNQANIQKSMAKTYMSLTKSEQRAINKGYRQIRRRMRNAVTNSRSTINPIGTGRMMADTYLKGELLSRQKR